MILLLIEIILLIFVGSAVIKAVEFLTNQGGLLFSFVAGIEKEIDILVDHIGQSKKLNEITGKEDLKKIEQLTIRLSVILLLAKPLYRCPVCMSSIWGSLIWLWWNQFSPIPIGTWPIYCLALCGTMSILEHWLENRGDVYVKNIIQTDTEYDHEKESINDT